MKTEQQLREEFDERLEHLLGTMSLLCEAEADEQFDMANLYSENIKKEEEGIFKWIQQQIKEAKIEVLEGIEFPNTQFADPDVVSYEKEIKRIIKEKLTQLKKFTK